MKNYLQLAMLLSVVIFASCGTGNKSKSSEISFTPVSLENLNPEGSEQSVSLTCNGDWEVADVDKLPQWIEVSPTSGTGSTVVNFKVMATQNNKVRDTNVMFRLKSGGTSFPFKISQNPTTVAISENMSYLGRGYDVSGGFAEDRSLRESVLDWNLLAVKNHVAPIINQNRSEEYIISGSTRNEYEKNLSARANVSTELYGFSGSVSSCFSKKALSSAENQFSTLRSKIEKQSIFIHANETAANLMECMSERFKNDVAKVAGKQMTAADLVLKYGTHVMTGFVLGGVLDYSMTADASSVEDAFDWNLAVSAGYKSLSTSVKGSTDIAQYENVKKQSANFEEKLLCRGGDSQFSTGGGNTSATYNQWLTSLSDANKWVMIDYAGSNLLPIEDFITNATVKAQVSAAVKNRLSGLGYGVNSTHRSLQIKIDELHTMLDNRGGDFNATQNFKLKITCGKDVQTVDCSYYAPQNLPNAMRKGETELTPGWDVWITRYYATDAELARLNKMLVSYPSKSIYKSHKLTIEVFLQYYAGKGKSFDRTQERKAEYVYDGNTMKWKKVSDANNMKPLVTSGNKVILSNMYNPDTYDSDYIIDYAGNIIDLYMGVSMIW